MKKPLLVAALMLGLAGTIHALDRTDYDLFRDVSGQVNSYVDFTIFDSVHVRVEAGFVTLFGKVTMPYKASDIEKRVAGVDGVKGVQNSIEVLPVSSYDASLRLDVARAIYSHPALWRYGRDPRPSIHVIVENGRVTLDGVVNNDADRSIALLVARSSSEFAVKNELKTNEEMQQLLETLYR